jgi:hypothetical protein
VVLIRGEAAYVQDFEELLAFMERRTGKLAVPGRPDNLLIEDDQRGR